jgi:glycyl-tRNA synthetase
MLALLEDGYQQEIVENSKGETTEREVLKLHPLLAPYFVAVIPWSKQTQLREKACQIYQELLNETSFTTTYEESK